MKKIFILILFSFLLFGCVTAANKTNNLKLGMTKIEVIQVMGNPSSTSESKEIAYLKYKLRDHFIADDYYIRLIGGKVDAFGRFGEFGLGY